MYICITNTLKKKRLPYSITSQVPGQCYLSGLLHTSKGGNSEYEAIVEWLLAEENQETLEKNCFIYTAHKVTQDWTQASVVRSQCVTAWAMACKMIYVDWNMWSGGYVVLEKCKGERNFVAKNEDTFKVR
jgi:hypothetical protein